ncbi:hypothetical protein ACFV0L_18475 [Streptosporangium canum]|uniref:hypothetical protein n=1 Tax=Streptosporangium canum TaxID=324952 RepID=UPI0036875C0C
MTGNTALDVFVIAGMIAGGLTLLGLLSKGGAWLWRTFGALKNFLDDWQGESERPGVPARPGIAARIAQIEDELRPNHGSSLRDAVNRTESGVRRVEDTLAAHLTEHRLAAAQQRVVINTTAVHAEVPREHEDSDDNTKGES